jgi:drug/metabolite transporter (DMT)-like permease
MVFGALTLLVLTLFTQGTAGITEVGAGAAPWLWIAALALGPTLMGYGLFTASLRWLPGRIASLVVLLEAPISSGLAVWLLGERLEPPQLVGILLVLSAAATPALDYLFPAARREPSLGG